MAETRLITVRYRGQTSGEGPLTLGQDNMIRCILPDERSPLIADDPEACSTLPLIAQGGGRRHKSQREDGAA